MGCFETKTYEENEDGGGQQHRRNNRNHNYEEENDSMKEEEFEDFKELDSKYNKFQLYFQFMKNIFL
jgi:hypothetical protein